MAAVKRKARAQFDEATKQQAIELFQNGSKAPEIARTVRCSIPVVYKWIRAARIEATQIRRVTQETSTEVAVTPQNAPRAHVHARRSEPSPTAATDALHDALVCEARTSIELRLLRSENDTLRQMCCEYQVQLREAQRRLRQEGR